MPRTVTAFSVKIASPGDAGMELIIVREVIGEWNARHALEQKRVLLPLDEVSARAHFPADLLIAFFCNSTGTPGDRTEAEIEKQLQGGRPALVYLSEGRADLLGTALPGRALDEFKKRCATAVVDSYGDEKEFRGKFARQLETTISGHPIFKTDGVSLPAAPVPQTARPLSSYAVTILSEACDDFEAYIGRIKVGGLLKIQANGKQLVEQDNPAAAAKWDSAFDELLAGDFIRDAGCNGQLFQISAKGFDFLKTIGKTPVGYIAELGGM
ncbi:MAG: hypothetical protein LV480_12590 [Methylacidiphilales bacterium]|nr:hypothetical protein [Candidatus Methylacidiphilales bacterium]